MKGNLNEYHVRRLGMILALQAEFEGMKVENAIREQNGNSMAFDYESFCEISARVHEISTCSEDKLMEI